MYSNSVIEHVGDWYLAVPSLLDARVMAELFMKPESARADRLTYEIARYGRVLCRAR
jgi:hypothetical protein